MKWVILIFVVLASGSAFASGGDSQSGSSGPAQAPDPSTPADDSAVDVGTALAIDSFDFFSEANMATVNEGDPISVGKSVGQSMGISSAMVNWGIAIYHHEGPGVRDR